MSIPNPDQQARLAQVRALAQAAASADSAHDFSHSLRVLKNALAIAQKEGGDLEVLTAAAFLHDIANLPKDHPESKMSSERSAEQAAQILLGFGMSAEKVALVRDAVLCHSYSRGLNPTTLEGRIFQDADRLDALGAIGVARTFAVGGALNRPMYCLDDPFLRKGRTPDDKRYTLDHLPVKLFKIGSQMQTETGREFARERTETMQRFIEALEAEVGQSHPLTSDDKPDAPA